MNLKLLSLPFEEISWRVAREVKNGAAVQVLAYIENRDVMNRLDEVCGPENWRNEYTNAPTGGNLCGLSIKCDGEWVTKWDGAENSDIEGVKGGLSDSMKRAAVQWGIGRYLYSFPNTFVALTDKGDNYHKCTKDNKTFPPNSTKYWNNPILPTQESKEISTNDVMIDLMAIIENSVTINELNLANKEITFKYSKLSKDQQLKIKELYTAKKNILSPTV